MTGLAMNAAALGLMVERYRNVNIRPDVASATVQLRVVLKIQLP